MNPPRLRILMSTDAVGGVWSYAIELCRALPQVDFLMANMGPFPTSDQRREIRSLPNAELMEGSFLLEWEEHPWRDLERAGKWLLSLERGFRPDLIHLNGYVHAALPWSAPVLVVAHSCVLSWWRAVKGEPAPAAWDAYAAAVRAGLHAAARVVAPTREMGKSLIANYEISAPLVIPNGSCRRNAGARPVKDPVILCAARIWDEAKNVTCLARAAEGLAWPVVLAGDARDVEIPWPNVQSVGRCSRDQMSAWYGRAGILAHPALYEPFGLAPLEGALAGCALVLSDIPSLREVWGDAAEFVDPTDPDAWRRTLARLTTDPVERARLSRRAAERAKDYPVARMAHDYLELYQLLTTPTLTAIP